MKKIVSIVAVTVMLALGMGGSSLAWAEERVGCVNVGEKKIAVGSSRSVLMADNMVIVAKDGPLCVSHTRVGHDANCSHPRSFVIENYYRATQPRAVYMSGMTPGHCTNYWIDIH